MKNLIKKRPQYNGLKPIRQSINSLTNHIFKKRSFKETLFFSNWDIIVGAEFSNKSLPLKITSNKNLVIQVKSSSALEFEYEIPTIMQKIKQFYGYNPIKKNYNKAKSKKKIYRK